MRAGEIIISPPAKPLHPDYIADIIHTVGAHFGQTQDQVTRKLRRGQASKPRQLAIHFVRLYTRAKLKDIAPVFHSTPSGIYNTDRKVRDFISVKDRSMYSHYTSCMRSINGLIGALYPTNGAYRRPTLYQVSLQQVEV